MALMRIASLPMLYGWHGTQGFLHADSCGDFVRIVQVQINYSFGIFWLLVFSNSGGGVSCDRLSLIAVNRSFLLLQTSKWKRGGCKSSIEKALWSMVRSHAWDVTSKYSVRSRINMDILTASLFLSIRCTPSAKSPLPQTLAQNDRKNKKRVFRQIHSTHIIYDQWVCVRMSVLVRFAFFGCFHLSNQPFFLFGLFFACAAFSGMHEFEPNILIIASLLVRSPLLWFTFFAVRLWKISL